MTFQSFNFLLGKRGKYFFLRVEFKSENIYKIPHTEKVLTNASFILSPSDAKVEKHEIARDSSPTLILGCGHSVTQLLGNLFSL